MLSFGKEEFSISVKLRKDGERNSFWRDVERNMNEFQFRSKNRLP